MSLEKAIAHGREHRKQFRKLCYLIDYTCRNHGGCGKKHSGGQCPWCLENRRIQTLRDNERVKNEILSSKNGDLL